MRSVASQRMLYQKPPSRLFLRSEIDDYRTPMAVAMRTVALLMAMAGAAHAQTAAIENFLAQLQRASQAGDRAAIAEMVRYPIPVSIGGLRVPFADAAALLDRYDDIFNSTLRDAIARASASAGSVIGLSEVVISEVNGQLRITSIAVPDETGGGGSPVVAPVARSTGTARKQERRRIAIRVGPRPTQVPGLLARDATDEFTLFLPKGRLAGIRLERAPVGSASIRVVHARTGAPLGSRASADGRYVSGRPSEDSDYRIEVRRTGGDDDAPLPYMLSLTLR
jgi:hypothetical protein